MALKTDMRRPFSDARNAGRSSCHKICCGSTTFNGYMYLYEYLLVHARRNRALDILKPGSKVESIGVPVWNIQ